MPSEKRKLGDICEGVAVKHLKRHGFEVIQRNYQKKWGEIDIIARESDLLHFIEVKGATDPKVKPEENVSPWKLKRLYRAIQTWLLDHEDFSELEWQIDVMAVFLDFASKKAKIRWTKNVILE